MENLSTILAALIGVALLNVWIIRVNCPTNYRGGAARTMKEEFQVYGLPDSLFVVVGGMKVGVALLLIGSLWLPQFVQPAALVLSILMLGAVVMHFKVSDPFRKAMPAVLLFCLALVLAVFESG